MPPPAIPSKASDAEDLSQVGVPILTSAESTHSSRMKTSEMKPQFTSAAIWLDKNGDKGVLDLQAQAESVDTPLFNTEEPLDFMEGDSTDLMSTVYNADSPSLDMFVDSAQSEVRIRHENFYARPAGLQDNGTSTFASSNTSGASPPHDLEPAPAVSRDNDSAPSQNWASPTSPMKVDLDDLYEMSQSQNEIQPAELTVLTTSDSMPAEVDPNFSKISNDSSKTMNTSLWGDVSFEDWLNGGIDLVARYQRINERINTLIRWVQSVI